MPKGQKMKLVKITDKLYAKQLKKLYKNAFPRAERKPLSLIKNRCKEGKMEVFAVISDACEFAGVVITALGESAVLIDYLAISTEVRSCGYGSQTLEILKKIYDGKKLIIEIEDPDVPSKNREQRIKRKNFYLKNGFKPLDFKISLFGCEMIMLGFPDCISFDEYRAIQESIFRKFPENKIYKIS